MNKAGLNSCPTGQMSGFESAIAGGLPQKGASLIKRRLFNDGWHFALGEEGGGQPAAGQWRAVEIPHDWLIWNTNDLYAKGMGWYKKSFNISKEELSGRKIYLRFDGVYMDVKVYINGSEAFEWKYGYSTFTFECGGLLRAGENTLVLSVSHVPPNSRWYSGAGIYRNVWLINCHESHFVPDGIYISAIKEKDGWCVKADCEHTAPAGCEIRHRLLDGQGRLAAESFGGEKQVFHVESPEIWDIGSPALYSLESTLFVGGEEVDKSLNTLGFRHIEFAAERGFFLNGRKLKIQGVCQHHDFGCLGAAFNSDAQRRHLEVLREMGVNAIRTSHNMPAPELMDLCDEMGFLVCSEAFDMWERSKTQYDYARFFKEWAARDVESWVRRDRNHPSLIMWSIGNEIYDTHADSRGLEITKMLEEQVRRHDPRGNGGVTIGSNFMYGENARKCADVVKLAGYNYGEDMYEAHHAQYPDWAIYGSETCSVVQSRGIYRFPLRQPLLADDDEQCSSLGNSSTSWGAKSTEACVLADYNAPFSMGQFIWTGTDYIGEPTPYHTKNSYFGQTDTAGFPKDSYYIFKAGWTDGNKDPFVHIFPYWDFSPGQEIDLRVCSNLPEVELFLNGKSLGRQRLGLDMGRLIADYCAPYEAGQLKAVAYDGEGRQAAVAFRESFGDTACIFAEADRQEIHADGKSLAFITIQAKDKQGRIVENASNRINVKVSGAGRLMGLDNGDSSDFEQYKCGSRRLFSGKLLAVVASCHEAGDISVDISSPGLESISLCLKSEAVKARSGASDTLMYIGEKTVGLENEVPLRKIELISEGGFVLSPDNKKIKVRARLYPENSSYRDLEWFACNAAGIATNMARLESGGDWAEIEAIGDGEVWLRCMSRNGKDKIKLISQLCFSCEGLGKPFIDPYNFVAGGLYTHSFGEMGNGNDKGVATPRELDSWVGFDNVDFGDFGSDTITLPVFAMDPEPFPIEIWRGFPGEAGGEMLLRVMYTSGNIWNTYIEDSYTLPKRLRGVCPISLKLDRKVHIKGFIFKRDEKAFSRLAATDNSALYGDSFRVEGGRVLEIGNNVSLGFNAMDFRERLPVSLVISGRTPHRENSIRLIMRGQQTGELVQSLEFEGGGDDFIQRSFAVDGLKNDIYNIEFVFLPGSNFDFDWFCFN